MKSAVDQKTKKISDKDVMQCSVRGRSQKTSTFVLERSLKSP